MEIGGAASAILFGIVTIVQLLLSFLVLSYAGYSFLTVFINTSAGSDEVLWPKDPFQDWMWKSWYLAWLLAIWAIPVWLITNLGAPVKPAMEANTSTNDNAAAHSRVPARNAATNTIRYNVRCCYLATTTVALMLL